MNSSTIISEKFDTPTNEDSTKKTHPQIANAIVVSMRLFTTHLSPTGSLVSISGGDSVHNSWVLII